MNGTSWLLGGGYPWHSGDPRPRSGSAPSAVVANGHDGLVAGARLPEGPLGLDCRTTVSAG